MVSEKHEEGLKVIGISDFGRITLVPRGNGTPAGTAILGSAGLPRRLTCLPLTAASYLQPALTRETKAQTTQWPTSRRTSLQSETFPSYSA